MPSNIQKLGSMMKYFPFWNALPDVAGIGVLLVMAIFLSKIASLYRP